MERLLCSSSDVERGRHSHLIQINRTNESDSANEHEVHFDLLGDPAVTVRRVTSIVVGGLLLAACGTSDGDVATPVETVTVTVTAEPAAPEPTETSPAPDGDSPSGVAEVGSSFENGVLTTPELRIEITRYEVIEVGAKGNEYGEKPVIAFWYKTTNLSGAKVDPTDFIFNFNAYQDNNPNAENELDVGALPDDRFLNSQTENIKKGRTVENAIAYELDDLDTPVDLVASEGLDEVIGKATYKLR